MQNKSECNCIESGYAQTTNHCPIHKTKKSKKSDSKTNDAVVDDVQDIALLMVKQLANKFIKVDNTWEGVVAQRHWYLEANEMIKTYIWRVKNHYKNIK